MPAKPPSVDGSERPHERGETGKDEKPDEKKDAGALLTTMMAVLTTARAVLKDEATRKQVHLIQDHLVALGKDFARFQSRMENLSKHISQAKEDVEDVHISSKKMASRFEKIEQVQLPNDESQLKIGE